jgi:hypothetical protein
MKAVLNVLSLGSADSNDMVRDALLQRHKCRLFVVTSVWELCAIPQHQDSFDIAILHHTLSRREVRDASEYIRRRWPRAKILVICADAEVLEDPLYDEWAPPGLTSGILLARIKQLTGGRKEK